MAARKGSRAEARSRRDGRRAVARARSSPHYRALLWALAGAVVVVTAALVLPGVAKPPGGQHGSQVSSPDISHGPATVAVGGYTSPPWQAPADASAAVTAAGLPMLDHEGTVEHIHAHLDVLIDGHAVDVPAGIGVDTRRGTISPLHTHDASGVIHIESPVKRQFSLGEFFSEWQVGLSQDNIGALQAGDGKIVRVLVNGTQRHGNPGAIMLGAHDQITVLYARPQPGEVIPSSFEFLGGL